MQNLSLVVHPQEWKGAKRKAAFDKLRALKPKVMRVSAMQEDVLCADNMRGLDELERSGIQIVAVLNAKGCANMSVKDWQRYVRNTIFYAKRYMRPGGIICWQPGNEWNIEKFWGGAPDAEKAWILWNTAYWIIKNEYGASAAVATPGLTCEFKTKFGVKIAAKDFMLHWLDRGADKLADYWCLHYYESDYAHKAVLYGNMDLIRSFGGEVVLTETGCSNTGRAVRWWEFMKKGIKGVLPERIFWYCFSHDNGFGLVSASLAESDVYKRMVQYGANKSQGA